MSGEFSLEHLRAARKHLIENAAIPFPSECRMPLPVSPEMGALIQEIEKAPDASWHNIEFLESLADSMRRNNIPAPYCIKMPDGLDVSYDFIVSTKYFMAWNYFAALGPKDRDYFCKLLKREIERTTCHDDES